ncbi:DHS-like NAD/FAD-binding domain-containing protein [Polychytrium aggregatum]|uniref:DHS-like NAD/FAD-binding domain-containing protein n=1 Tax=Polychytrium aggregatum TaxID=110093 RepID=UPI0022FE6765|nr:DHS-like NAD/FAD-binding domain-containing protein [Polychytrium aggregatum]KAI9205137.1 DHS-like NAD/FAD-binding domain-containing protein [Polychytrium aggregatum]
MSYSAALPSTRAHARKLADFILRAEGKCTVLTGAGVSTDSDIPDYRGPNGVYVRNKDYKPIQYQEFMGRHYSRQRYWARSYLGWPKIARVSPNETHLAIAEIEKRGLMDSGLITQNVDGLHRNFKTLELHGTLHQVHCTSCKHTVPREEFQQELARLNPIVSMWAAHNPEKLQGDVASSTPMNPDGDTEYQWDYSQFVYPSCVKCGSVYKPSVIFFGENISAHDRDRSFSMVDDGNALLAIGTSLQVYSSFRLVQRAAKDHKPITILNLGETRGDPLATLKIESRSSHVLAETLDLL